MKRITMLFVLIGNIFVYSQGWEFSGYFPDQNFKGTYAGSGIAVDPDGKVWIQLYNPSDSILTGSGTYSAIRVIYVFNPDGTPASFSPIKTVTVNGTTDTLWNSNRGMREDNNGNILISSFDILYRLNYKTGEGMNKFIYPNGSGEQTLTAPAVDSSGNVYVAGVLPSNPIQELNPDLTLAGTAINSSVGFSRTLEVSKDGNTVYWCGYSNNCVYIYSRADAHSAFSLTDTVMKGFQCESIAWDPATRYLWASSGSQYGGKPNQYPGVNTNYTWPTFYAWDTNTWTIKDSINWKLTSPFDDARPRGIAFDKTGETAYVICFGGDNYPAVEVFKRYKNRALNVPGQYSTIQSALNSAYSGDTVLVQPGKYYENLSWPSVNGIKLIASGNYSNTIIDGGNKGCVINFQSVSGIDTSTVISGFCITHGGNTQQGAGINGPVSYPLIENVKIESNQSTANGTGGGIYSNGVIIKNSIIIGNSASTGGGIYLGSSNISMFDNVVFLNNSADYGGALFTGGNVNAEFSHVVMSGNKANYQGGGIKTGGGINISQTTFFNNQAPSGGDVYCDGGAPSISKNTFIDDTVSNSNSIYISPASTPSINKNNFVNLSRCLENNNTTSIVDASDNYWGNSSGPYSLTQNIHGTGDTVSGFLNILPFLTEPDTIAPPVPVQNVATALKSGTTINVVWSKSKITDLKGYKVYWDADFAGYSYKNSADAGKDTSYTITGLILGNTYHIAVTVYDNSGDESWFSTDITAKAVGPVLELSAGELDFPNTAVGDSASIHIKVFSGSESLLIVDSLSNRSSVFNESIMLPVIVAEGDSLDINLKFKPDQFGDFTDTLSIASNGGEAKVILKGQSPAPTLLTTSTKIDFGSVVRNTSAEATLKLTNSSVNVLSVDSIYTKSPQFTATPPSGSAGKDEFFNVTVTFTPNSFGPAADTLYLQNNSANSLVKIPLTGHSPFQLLLNDTGLNFGSIAKGQSSTMNIAVKNLFNVPVNLDSIYTGTPQFSVAPNKAVLNQSDSLQLEVRFKPDSFGTFTDSVMLINKEAGSAIVIKLEGNSPFPHIAADNYELKFDSVVINSSSTKIITLKNTSINELKVDSVFNLSSAFKANLSGQSGIIKSGDSIKISVEFAPKEAGSFSDTLFVVNNSETNPLKIFVNGRGILTTSVSEGLNSSPKTFTVYQNYPNPFNPTTTIKYEVPKESYVKICVYNLLGEVVANLVSGTKNAGYYNIIWNASNVVSGIYYYSTYFKPLDGSNEIRNIKKMILLK